MKTFARLPTATFEEACVFNKVNKLYHSWQHLKHFKVTILESFKILVINSKIESQKRQKCHINVCIMPRLYI